jgi:hypothetical protein
MPPSYNTRQSKMLVRYPKDSLTIPKMYVILIHDLNDTVPLDTNVSSTHHAGSHPKVNVIINTQISPWLPNLLMALPQFAWGN